METEDRNNIHRWTIEVQFTRGGFTSYEGGSGIRYDLYVHDYNQYGSGTPNTICVIESPKYDYELWSLLKNDWYVIIRDVRDIISGDTKISIRREY